MANDEVKNCTTCKNCYDNYKCNRTSCLGYDLWEPREDAAAVGPTGTTEEAKHYQIGTLQPIEIMQEVMSPEEFQGFLRGNVIKYSQRMGHKGSVREDAGKVAQYATWLCEALDGKKIVPGGKK